MFEYVLKNPGTIEKTEQNLPAPAADEALVKMKYIGICGSDIHLYHGTYNGPHSYPMLFGHEWAGEVVSAGKDAGDLKPGDVVTGDCSRYCGTCARCAEDKNLCESIEKFGITIDGASAEYIIRKAKYIYKAEPGIEEQLLCLTEPIAVAAHLISKIRQTCNREMADLNILVMGGGVIGMSAMMLLKYMYHCEQVSLYDLSEYRKDIARKADARIPDDDSLNIAVQDGNYATLYNAAKYDVVIETTGVPAVFTNTFNLLKPAGILGCVGMAAEVVIPQKQIVTKALTVVGSIGGTGDFPFAMEFITRYPEEAKKLISHYYSMAELEEAFSTAQKADISMKVVLTV